MKIKKKIKNIFVLILIGLSSLALCKIASKEEKMPDTASLFKIHSVFSTKNVPDLLP